MNTSSLFSFFVETAVKASALLVVAGTLTLLLRKNSAALRHLVWTLAFASVLTLPILSLALPALSLPVADVPAFVFRTTASAGAQPITSAKSGGSLTARLQSDPTDWRMALLFIWVTGAGISFAQMLIGWLALARLRRDALPLKVTPEAELLETAARTMPMTCGSIRPAILLPPEAKNWDPERLRLVVLHEMAHVQRRDVATHLLARVALCLYWWNPLAWFAFREFVKERERAADDLVLNAGECGSNYASHLLEIARSMQSSAAWSWSAVTMASRSQLEGRLLAILDSTRNRNTPRRLGILAGAMAVLILLVPAAAVHAQSESSLMKAGDAARDQGKYAEAKALYTKAITTATAPSEALINRGVVELNTKDYPAALSDFELAQKEGKSPNGRALMWQAIAQQNLDNAPAAQALYQKALDASDPQSMTSAVIMELYASVLEDKGQSDDAVKLRKQSYEIRTTQARLLSSATQVGSVMVYRAGKDVKSPVLKTKVEPEYAAEARAAKYSGTVLLSVEIGPDGTTHNVQVVRPLGLGLDEKAEQAVSQWRFQPGTKDGQPVTVAATIEVNFRLL
jgi:TonB family protein